MKDNGIGTELAMFYEAFAAIYERKRLFNMTNKALLLGITKGSKPTEKILGAMK